MADFEDKQEQQERQNDLLEQSVDQTAEVTKKNSKFAGILREIGADAREKKEEKTASIKESVMSTVKSAPDALASGIQDPAGRMAAMTALGAAKKVPQVGRYAKGLYNRATGKEKSKVNNKEEPKPKKVKQLPKRSAERRNIEASIQTSEQIGDQTDRLKAIQEQSEKTALTVSDILSFMKSDSLDDFEKSREKARMDDQMLSTLASIEGNTEDLSDGSEGSSNEDKPSGLAGVIQSVKDNFGELAVGSFFLKKGFERLKGGAGKALGSLKKVGKIGAAITGISFLFRNLKIALPGVIDSIRNAATNIGRSVASALGLKPKLPPKGPAPRPGSGTAATKGLAQSAPVASRTAAAAAAATMANASKNSTSARPRPGSGSASQSAPKTGATSVPKASPASKFPRLAKFVKLTRQVPLLARVAGGAEAIMIASNDDIPLKEKKKRLSGLLGSYIGGTGGAKLGAILGAFGGPVGSIAGLLAGGVGGAFAGDFIGQKLAGFLLGDDSKGDAPKVPDTPRGSDNPRANRSRGTGAGSASSIPKGTVTIGAPRMTRSRVDDINRAKADRDNAEKTSSGRMNQSRSNASGDVNVATNVTNNSNTTVQNRPPAYSMPDNMSDTMMGSGFAP